MTKKGRVLLLLIATACGGGQQDQNNGAALDTAPPASTAGAGEMLYQQRCVSCHQLNGQGLPGTFPPLAGSEYATATNPAAPIRVVLHGIGGPLRVKGVQYDGLMPAYGVGVEMSDDEVASVLTYVRQAWGNQAGAISAQDVARTRAAARSRTGSLDAAELAALMKAPAAP